MNKEELIGKLQMVYVGDINVLNELIGYYDGLKIAIEMVQQENEKLNHYKLLYQRVKERNDRAIEYVNHPWKFECDDSDCNLLIHNRKRFLLDILKGNNEEVSGE